MGTLVFIARREGGREEGRGGGERERKRERDRQGIYVGCIYICIQGGNGKREGKGRNLLHIILPREGREGGEGRKREWGG